jgi:hypothetical protein
VKKNYFLHICSLLFILIALAACNPGEVPATEGPVETQQATDEPSIKPTATVETEEPSPEPEETNEPEDSETGEEVSPEEISACIECHTDKTMLIETSAPQEEVESENEGAG